MKNGKGHEKISRFLSYVLRHRPHEIKLELDAGGWARVDELLAGAPQSLGLSRSLLEEVVAANDKRRFSLSPDGRRIRAVQGHSIAVDLGLKVVEPPEFLYHGTAERFVESIMKDGLQPRSRQYVHLSGDEASAIEIGRRHGRPVVLQILARRMHEEGYAFYRAENGVWLAESIAPENLTLLP